MNPDPNWVNEVRALEPKGRKWVNYGPLAAYIRVTERCIAGCRVPTLEIASVEVEKDDRGKGLFGTFLASIMDLALVMKRVVYIENVLTERLSTYLQGKGFKPVELCRISDDKYVFSYAQNTPEGPVIPRLGYLREDIIRFIARIAWEAQNAAAQEMSDFPEPHITWDNAPGLTHKLAFKRACAIIGNPYADVRDYYRLTRNPNARKRELSFHELFESDRVRHTVFYQTVRSLQDAIHNPSNAIIFSEMLHRAQIRLHPSN